MIDLILTASAEGPATLFTRNFRVHAGIPIGLYREGPRSPVALIYGDASDDTIHYYAEHYKGLIVIPAAYHDEIPTQPMHYETMTVKAPILARVQDIQREGYTCYVQTHEGGPLVLEGICGSTVVMLFTADLVKATIRILSGELEEHTGFDQHGRHQPLPESVIHAPGVSFHFNLIEQSLRHLHRRLGLPLLSIPRWPASAPLALFISHDVDVVKKWTAKRVGYEVTRSLGELLRFRFRPMRTTIASLREAMRNHDPYWNFNDILYLEDSNGFRATWFFAPFGGEYAKRESEYDPIYRRKSSEITAMIRHLREQGCEVALHGTRGAHLEERTLRRQMEWCESRLGFRLQGVRHHYLFFRHGKTLETAAASGLAYDATLGFSDRPGFRNGMASPFFPFAADHPSGKIVEIPLNLMDSFFLHGEGGLDAVRRRATESYLYARAAGGLFSVLAHPGNMDPAEIPGWGDFYRSFIPRCGIDGARAMTGAQIAEWWTARERVLRSFEYAPGFWRVKGVPVPEEMEFSITAPGLKSMQFAIEGVKGGTQVSGDTLTLRPGRVDPCSGFAVARKG